MLSLINGKDRFNHSGKALVFPFQNIWSTNFKEAFKLTLLFIREQALLFSPFHATYTKVISRYKHLEYFDFQVVI
jgi:hypothetical protein